MNKLGINFENCYGIGKLDFVFDFSNTNSFLIYAPNGMMKTSFAKTLKYFNNDAEAPFFKSADYGVVGDAAQIVPALTEKIKALKGH